MYTSYYIILHYLINYFVSLIVNFEHFFKKKGNTIIISISSKDGKLIIKILIIKVYKIEYNM